MSPPIFTAEELAQVHALHAPAYLNVALSFPFWLLVFGILLRFGVRPLDALASRLTARVTRAFPSARSATGSRVLVGALDRLWGGAGWGHAILFACLLGVVLYLANLPASVYFEYILPHRYGLSRATPRDFILDNAKDVMGVLLFSTCLALGLFGLIRRLPRWWLMLGVVSAALLTFSAALDPLRSQLVFDHESLPPGELRDTLTAAMTAAHIPVADIVVEKTARYSRKVQAYFEGQGPTRKIVLNDSLVADMTPREVLAVVAHEAGHVVQPRSRAKLLAALALFGFLFLMSRVFAEAARRRWFGVSERGDIRLLPLMTFIFFLLQSLANPVAAAMSRRREAAADAFALALTRDPATFRSMLIKATRINLMDPEPPRWVFLLVADHPTVSQRLAAAERFQPP